jgi:hypothetical protein
MFKRSQYSTIFCDFELFFLRYDNRPLTQVMSRAELSFGKYYFDNTLELLWVHLENPLRAYDIFYGAAYQSANFSIQVVAWCPGNNCSSS